MIPADLRKQLPERVTSFIDGGFVPARGHEIPVIYPATEEQVAVLHEADAATVDQAVQSARQSLASGVWRTLPVAEKQRIFARIGELTSAHIDELALLETVNTGQAIGYTRQAQLPRIAANFKFFAEWMAQATEKAAFEDGRMLRYTTRHPLGVVAAISSSNAPTALASTKIAAALCYGNSCVVKTSENTPLALARFMEILVEAGVPRGVVNMVNGRGDVTGDALSDHPWIAGISFTGGNATAGRIAAKAAPLHKRLDFELGGKSANIVMPSADLDLAVTAALLAIYTNNGQQCFAGSRIVLHRDIADRFIAQFVARANRIRVGDPFAPGTQNGPLAFRRHYDRVMSYVDIARAEGAELLAGGCRPRELDHGLYVRPTAFLAPDNQARICQEEVFGPFASILIVDSIEAAIAVANQSPFGLVSYVWSNDQREVLAATQAIEAGLVMVNTPLLSLDSRMPFGGFRQSGIGREGAEGSRAFYTEEKTIAIALQPPVLPPIGLED